MEGQKFAGYVVREALGIGAFGTVYRVQKNNQDFALKIPHADVADDFLREVEISKELRHPRIIRQYENGKEDGQPYLVTEYADQGSLDNVLKGNPMEYKSAVSTALQVLSALTYAHDKGVVHLDIKPANVLLHSDGNVKLSDFGLARLISRELSRIGNSLQSGNPPPSQSRFSSRLASGKEDREKIYTRWGTLAYMSPEQNKGVLDDPRNDLYAVAKVLYQLLAGELPSEGVDGPSEENEGVPSALDPVVMKGLKKAEKRYQSAQEFYDALSPFVEGTVSQREAPRAVPDAPREQPGREQNAIREDLLRPDTPLISDVLDRIRSREDSGRPLPNIPLPDKIDIPDGLFSRTGSGTRRTPRVEVTRDGLDSRLERFRKGDRVVVDEPLYVDKDILLPERNYEFREGIILKRGRLRIDGGASIHAKTSAAWLRTDEYAANASVELVGTEKRPVEFFQDRPVTLLDLDGVDDVVMEYCNFFDADFQANVEHVDRFVLRNAKVRGNRAQWNLKRLNQALFEKLKTPENSLESEIYANDCERLVVRDTSLSAIVAELCKDVHLSGLTHRLSLSSANVESDVLTVDGFRYQGDKPCVFDARVLEMKNYVARDVLGQLRVKVGEKGEVKNCKIYRQKKEADYHENGKRINDEGVLITGKGNLTVDDFLVANSVTRGMKISFDGSVVIRNGTVQGNGGGKGGSGLAVGREPERSSRLEVKLSDVTFVENEADALVMSADKGTLSRCRFKGNRKSGSVLRAMKPGDCPEPRYDLNGCEFIGNSDNYSLLYADKSHVVLDERCKIADNDVEKLKDTRSGWEDATVTIPDTVIRE